MYLNIIKSIFIKSVVLFNFYIKMVFPGGIEPLGVHPAFIMPVA